MSFHQKSKSSTVSGSPSDHLMPSRNLAVRTVASSFQVKLSSRFGRMPDMSRFHLSSGSTQMVWRNQPLSFWLSTMRQVPPYWPTSSTGSITSGDAGRRSSTGGRSPAATFSASMGASLYFPAGAAGWAAAGAASSAGGAGAAAGAPPQAASRSTAARAERQHNTETCSHFVTFLVCVQSKEPIERTQNPGTVRQRKKHHVRSPGDGLLECVMESMRSKSIMPALSVVDSFAGPLATRHVGHGPSRPHR